VISAIGIAELLLKYSVSELDEDEDDDEDDMMMIAGVAGAGVILGRL